MEYLSLPRLVETDEYGLSLYPPGVTVPAGEYLRSDRPWAPTFVLDRSGALPASLDGRRVRYIRLATAPAGA